MRKILNKKRFNISSLKFRVSGLFRDSKFETRNSSRGFTILFAVLVGGLLFSMGIAIANVALKEVTLTTAGKSSEAAFFAADTGTECALYFDLVAGRTSLKFPNSSNNVPAEEDRVIRCNDIDIFLTYVTNTTKAITTFYATWSSEFPNKACVEVTITKTVPIPPIPGTTVIEARGRNDSDCTPEAPDNPGRVERALRVRY